MNNCASVISATSRLSRFISICAFASRRLSREVLMEGASAGSQSSGMIFDFVCACTGNRHAQIRNAGSRTRRSMALSYRLARADAILCRLRGALLLITSRFEHADALVAIGQPNGQGESFPFTALDCEFAAMLTH